jgi:hypothetical protein
MKMPKISLILYFLGFVLSSSDIFLTLQLGGTIRPSIPFFGIIILFVLSKILLTSKIIVPTGFFFLVSWTLMVLIFVPNTNLLSRSVVWAILMVFDVLIVLAIVNSFSIKRFYVLIKYYLYSFVAIAIFGLIQFLTPLLRLPPLLVTQWIFPGILPRLNALSYEPSYFATYMLIGWSFTAYLVKVKSDFLPKNHLRNIFWILTTVLILSTSKLGWACILLWYLQYPIIFFKNLISSKLRLKTLSLIIVFLSLALVIIFTISNNLIKDQSFFDFTIFLQGTGLAGTADHSVAGRSDLMFDTLKVFYRSPLIGYSLGGIAPAIGRMYGVDVYDTDIAKRFEGMNVYAEVLAATGIIGMILFLLYFISLFVASIKKFMTSNLDETRRQIILGLFISLLIELFSLNFAQTITRIYLWVHIGMLSAALKIPDSSEPTVRIEKKIGNPETLIQL